MGGYIVRRLMLSLLLVVVVSVTTFSLSLLGGDQAAGLAGAGGSAIDAAHLRALYGYDRPVVEQYLSWVVSQFEISTPRFL